MIITAMLQPLSDWSDDHEDRPEPDPDPTDDYNEIGRESLSPADRNPSMLR